MDGEFVLGVCEMSVLCVLWQGWEYGGWDSLES